MSGDVDRRELLRGLLAAAVVCGTGPELFPPAAHAADPVLVDGATAGTMEAFADTVVPGAKRSTGDHAVAGAAAGPGAVHAGALALLTMPELGVAALLPGMALLLNGQATAYAVGHGIWLPWDRPPFVGLAFVHRTALLHRLVSPDAVDRPLWIVLAFLAGLAFDTAAHLHTADAARSGHPGLGWLGFPPPGPDGLWRFDQFSYRRALARPHPATSPSGSPS